MSTSLDNPTLYKTKLTSATMDFNELEYGNPSSELLEYLNTENYLDVIFEEFSRPEFTYPSNDSSITRAELNDLVLKCSITQLDTETKIKPRYQKYDQSVFGTYKAVRFDNPEHAEDYSKLLIDIFADVLPVLFKLKFHFQRPRPYQLASYHKLKLFPFMSGSSDSPAYPSLHACMGKVLATVLGNNYPNNMKYFNDLGNDMAISRLYWGANYKSSVDAGILLADRIVNNDQFHSKYYKA